MIRSFLPTLAELALDAVAAFWDSLEVVDGSSPKNYGRTHPRQSPGGDTAIYPPATRRISIPCHGSLRGLVVLGTARTHSRLSIHHATLDWGDGGSLVLLDLSGSRAGTFMDGVPGHLDRIGMVFS